MGISSLFHNIILLRFVEGKSKMKRSIVLLKMRASYHDNSILEFVISDKGMKIIGTMDNYEEMLPDTLQQSYNEFPKMEDKITVQQQHKRKKRLAEFGTDETKILNREIMETKKSKEKTKKTLGIDDKNNLIDKKQHVKQK
jgi:hypothetical protein